MLKPSFTVFVAVTLSIAQNAHAAETIAYTYDAKGRLIKVVRSGTVNNNVIETTYTYDKANNRKSVVTTGSNN